MAQPWHGPAVSSIAQEDDWQEGGASEQVLLVPNHPGQIEGMLTMPVADAAFSGQIQQMDVKFALPVMPAGMGHRSVGIDARELISTKRCLLPECPSPKAQQPPCPRLTVGAGTGSSVGDWAATELIELRFALEEEQTGRRIYEAKLRDALGQIHDLVSNQKERERFESTVWFGIESLKRQHSEADSRIKHVESVTTGCMAQAMIEQEQVTRNSNVRPVQVFDSIAARMREMEMQLDNTISSIEQRFADRESQLAALSDEVKHCTVSFGTQLKPDTQNCGSVIVSDEMRRCNETIAQLRKEVQEHIAAISDIESTARGVTACETLVGKHQEDIKQIHVALKTVEKSVDACAPMKSIADSERRNTQLSNRFIEVEEHLSNLSERLDRACPRDSPTEAPDHSLQAESLTEQIGKRFLQIDDDMRRLAGEVANLQSGRSAISARPAHADQRVEQLPAVCVGTEAHVRRLAERLDGLQGQYSATAVRSGSFANSIERVPSPVRLPSSPGAQAIHAANSMDRALSPARALAPSSPRLATPPEFQRHVGPTADRACSPVVIGPRTSRVSMPTVSDLLRHLDPSSQQVLAPRPCGGSQTPRAATPEFSLRPHPVVRGQAPVLRTLRNWPT